MEWQNIDPSIEGTEYYFDDYVAVMRIRSNAFEHLADLEKGRKLLAFFEEVENNPEIRALLIIGEERGFGIMAYEKFLSTISGKNIDDHNINEILEIDKKLIRAREINLLNRFIMKSVEFKKILAFAMRGRVVTPFFGSCLSSDFRFAEEGMCFSLAHVRFGLHPSGALPFFLPKYIGQGRAVEILLKGGEISAEEAVQLNLINTIFPKDGFMERCISEIKSYCKIDPSVMMITKKFTYSFIEELQHYIDMESKYVKR